MRNMYVTSDELFPKLNYISRGADRKAVERNDGEANGSVIHT